MLLHPRNRLHLSVLDRDLKYTCNKIDLHIYYTCIFILILYSGYVVMKAFIYVRRSETESQTKIHLKIASADEFKHTMDSQLEHQSRKQQKLMDYTKYTCYTIIYLQIKSA